MRASEEDQIDQNHTPTVASVQEREHVANLTIVIVSLPSIVSCWTLTEKQVRRGVDLPIRRH